MEKKHGLKHIYFLLMVWMPLVLNSGICMADFTYSIGSPGDASADRYVMSKSNISVRSEGDFVYLSPDSGGTTLGTTPPGVVIYRFSFLEAISEATLAISTHTFHWSYSQGHSIIYVSADGNQWIELAEATSPEYGGYNSGGFSGALPQNFIGEDDIYVKVELYSYGKSASKGGYYCNTAQHLRYDKTKNTVTFKLEVKTGSVPLEESLPLPTDKTSFQAYSPVTEAETSGEPSECKPIGVGTIANDGDTVDINIKLTSPAGPYDAYLALQALDLDPDTIFLLSQDGTFSASSQSPLIKWKQSAQGPIDEKPVGVFSSSSLPPGTYRLYFLLTEVNSLESYYQWSTEFVIPEPTIAVPVGSAGFSNNTLVAPEATILYQGDTYDGAAPFPENGIATIIKDENIYFYHPAMGQAELSETNSKRAVSYFLTGLSASEIEARRAKQSKSYRSGYESPWRNATNITKVLNMKGQRVTLDTDITLEVLDLCALIKASNNRRRWAAVKTGLDDGDHIYFLLPRDNSYPTEFLDQLVWVPELIFGGVEEALWGIGNEREDILASDKIETFGAISWWRSGKLSDYQRSSLEKDLDLSRLVNVLDIEYTILEFTRNLLGVVPIDCSGPLVNGLFRFLQIYVSEWLGADGFAVENLKIDGMKSFVSSCIVCSMKLLSVSTIVGLPIAGALSIYTKFFSYLSLAQYLTEDVLEEYIANQPTYDLAILGNEEQIAYLRKDAAGTETQIIHNMKDNTIWPVPSNADDNCRIAAFTPNGDVLSICDADPDNLITTLDWGKGNRFDIGAINNLDYIYLRQSFSISTRLVDISDSGRLFFHARKKLSESDGDSQSGIFTTMANGSDGHFVPIVIDQDEYNYRGLDSFYVGALSVSSDGQVIAFSNSNTLYCVDSSGGNLRKLVDSDDSIFHIDMGDSGSTILFDYTPEDDETGLCTVAANGGSVVNLSKISKLELSTYTSTISPDGNWAAAMYLDQDGHREGVAFLRTDGSDYYTIDIKNTGITPILYPLSFTRDGKSVLFAGYDPATSGGKGNYDIFIMDNNKVRANLRNLTNSTEHKETFPIAR